MEIGSSSFKKLLKVSTAKILLTVKHLLTARFSIMTYMLVWFFFFLNGIEKFDWFWLKYLQLHYFLNSFLFPFSLRRDTSGAQ